MQAKQQELEMLYEQRLQELIAERNLIEEQLVTKEREVEAVGERQEREK